jgi:hypothetical protein
VTGDMLRELAHLFAVEADAVAGDPYAWPPPPAPTREQLEEMSRLWAIADALAERARRTAA